mmetsp:Transcript_29846/g.58465  ORF Transcript_29846/g.58465 Transcript_29846/m.58465 type:complete len:457 (+) Transcript_29846:30-1400(+)
MRSVRIRLPALRECIRQRPQFVRFSSSLSSSRYTPKISAKFPHSQHLWRSFATDLAEKPEEEADAEEPDRLINDPDADDAFFDAPSHEQRLADHVDLYTPLQQLTSATEMDVGKWFLVDPNVLSTPPLKTRWIHTNVKELFEMAGQYLMLRQPAFDLLTAFQDMLVDSKAEKGAAIGVHGPRGSGKSVTLHTLTQAAIQNKEHCLYISLDAREVVADHHGFLFPSPTREKIHMQGRWAKNFFTVLLDSQPETLKKVSLKLDYDFDWILRGETGQMSEQELAEMDAVSVKRLDGKTLHDLALYAADNSTIAGECLYKFVDEVIVATEVTPIVVLDSINLWDQKSEFRDPANPFKKLDPRQLSAVHALSKFMVSAPQNGMSVFATTSNATLNMSKKHMVDATYALEVPVYNNREISQCVWHYKVSKFIYAEVDVFLLARIKGMTGGVPKDVFTDALII